MCPDIHLRVVSLSREVQFWPLDGSSALSSLRDEGQGREDTGWAGSDSGWSRRVSLSLHTTTSLQHQGSALRRVRERRLTLTTGMVPGRVVVVEVAVCADRRGEGVGRMEELGSVVEWGGLETADDCDTAEDRLFPPFLAPFTATETSISCRERGMLHLLTTIRDLHTLTRSHLAPLHTQLLTCAGMSSSFLSRACSIS